LGRFDLLHLYLLPFHRGLGDPFDLLGLLGLLGLSDLLDL
jgi:hypothetical protein